MSELTLLVSPLGTGYVAQGFCGLTEVTVLQAATLDELLQLVFREIDRLGPFETVEGFTLRFKLRHGT